MHMRLVTVELEVYANEALDNIAPRVNVDVEEGIPVNVALSAAIGGTKSMLRALEKELEKYTTSPEEITSCQPHDNLTEQPTSISHEGGDRG